jgi:hypothetical protein
LSFLTLDPWSLAIVAYLLGSLRSLSFTRHRRPHTRSG